MPDNQPSPLRLEPEDLGPPRVGWRFPSTFDIENSSSSPSCDVCHDPVNRYDAMARCCPTMAALAWAHLGCIRHRGDVL